MMDKKDIIILVVVGIIVAFRLYQKKMKKEKDRSGSEDSASHPSGSSQGGDYEPYSGRKD